MTVGSGDNRDSNTGRNTVRVTTRGDTLEVHMGDPSSLVIQLQDARYCRGAEPSEKSVRRRSLHRAPVPCRSAD